MQISFWGQTLPQLQQFFAARGENPAKAALVYESIYRRGQRDFAALIWLKEPLRRALDEHFSLALPQVIARADDGHPLAQFIDIGVAQVVDSKMNIAKAFALDMQDLGAPYAGPDKDRLIPIAEKIIDADGIPNTNIGPNFNSF